MNPLRTEPQRLQDIADRLAGYDPNALAVAQAQAFIAALVPTVQGVEQLALRSALGRVLAQPILSPLDVPSHDNSAMDGYALRSADLPGPWRVIGESAAGHPFAGTVGAGEAVRISTGAHVPAGADMVLLQEDAGRDGSQLALTGTPPSPTHKHIRRCGGDFADGALLLASGTVLGPAQLALVIGAGHSHVAVRRRPRVAILATGSEVVEPGNGAGAPAVLTSLVATERPLV